MVMVTCWARWSNFCRRAFRLAGWIFSRAFAGRLDISDISDIALTLDGIIDDMLDWAADGSTVIQFVEVVLQIASNFPSLQASCGLCRFRRIP